MKKDKKRIGISAGQCVQKFQTRRFSKGLQTGVLGLALGAAAVPMVFAPMAYGQLTTADILGTVTDQTGAVVPNASITLVNVNTKETRTAVSGSSGDYQFTLLPVGTYMVTTKAQGFKTSTRDEPGRRSRRPCALGCKARNRADRARW